MDQQQFDTRFLWRILKGILGAFLVSIIFILMYIPMKPVLRKWQEQPKMTAEAKAKYIKERTLAFDRAKENDQDRVENGIHVMTGLVYDQNFQIVRAACTSCHSAKLITQNRATRSGWKQMITWMQETQGLPDLGDQEGVILDYLSTHYAPEEAGRRPNLDVAAIEWYILELDQ